MPVENIVGKGENAGYQHFLLFPKSFLPFPHQISIFQPHLFCRPQNAFNLDQSKILLSDNGLIHTITTFNDPEKDAL